MGLERSGGTQLQDLPPTVAKTIHRGVRVTVLQPHLAAPAEHRLVKYEGVCVRFAPRRGRCSIRHLAKGRRLVAMVLQGKACGKRPRNEYSWIPESLPATSSARLARRRICFAHRTSLERCRPSPHQSEHCAGHVWHPPPGPSRIRQTPNSEDTGISRAPRSCRALAPHILRYGFPNTRAGSELRYMVSAPT